jgi:hypothetical protein
MELSGGSVFEGTTSGCDAVDVGSCSHFDRRLVGTSSTLEGGLRENRHTERQHTMTAPGRLEADPSGISLLIEASASRRSVTPASGGARSDSDVSVQPYGRSSGSGWNVERVAWLFADSLAEAHGSAQERDDGAGGRAHRRSGK